MTTTKCRAAIKSQTGEKNYSSDKNSAALEFQTQIHFTFVIVTVPAMQATVCNGGKFIFFVSFAIKKFIMFHTKMILMKNGHNKLKFVSRIF
jgi:hypothetical protein